MIAIVFLLAKEGVGTKQPALTKFEMCLDTQVGLLCRKLSGGAWSFRKWFGSEVTSTRSWELEPRSGHLPLPPYPKALVVE